MYPVCRTSRVTATIAILILSSLCATTLAAPVEVATATQLQLPSSTTPSATVRIDTIPPVTQQQTEKKAHTTHDQQQHLSARNVLQKRVNITPDSAGSLLTVILVVVGCTVGIGAASIAVFGFEWKRWSRGATRQEHIDPLPRVEEKGDDGTTTDQNSQEKQDRKQSKGGRRMK